MLSIIIATYDSERVLVPTLAALVPGATAGIVREVIITDAGSRDETAKIADIAGCRLVVNEAPLGARLSAAAALARGSWLVFLRPGIALDAMWTDEAHRFVQQVELADEAAAAVFRPALLLGERRSPLVQAFALLGAGLRRRARPEQGLLIAKRHYEKIGGHRAGAAEPEIDLLRRLGRHITTLNSSATLVRDW